MARKLKRVEVLEGYDLWSKTYDRTPNPLVALDRRHTMGVLAVRRGEQILDAGCGTGANLHAMMRAGAHPVGVDYSWGMLRVARRSVPRAPLVRADIDAKLPIKARVFDAFLCALVSEHLKNLKLVFREAFAALRPGGRLVFSIFHPDIAISGVEANFARSGVEYRLGALPYRVDDYLNFAADAGFRDVSKRDFRGDVKLVDEIPQAAKYLHRPLLMIVTGRKPV
jgi:SAM-dependent methyltransferase